MLVSKMRVRTREKHEKKKKRAQRERFFLYYTMQGFAAVNKHLISGCVLTGYFVPGIPTLAYSCYDITDKGTLGHLVIY